MPNVPAPIAIAFATNRKEFLYLFRSQIEKGQETLSKQDALTIVDLLFQALGEREEDQRKTAVLNRLLENLESQIKGLPRKLAHIQEVGEAIQKGTELPEE